MMNRSKIKGLEKGVFFLCVVLTRYHVLVLGWGLVAGQGYKGSAVSSDWAACIGWLVAGSGQGRGHLDS